MNGKLQIAEAQYQGNVCGFDKHHFSKAVLLSYKRGYLSERDLVAIHQIESAVMAIEAEGFKQSGLSRLHLPRIPARGVSSDYVYLAESRFTAWIDTLTRNKIAAGAILDLIIKGKSFIFVDRRFKKANGWAHKNLIKGIEVWNINNIQC